MMTCRRFPRWTALPLLFAAAVACGPAATGEGDALFQEIAFFQAVKIPVFAEGSSISTASRAAPLIVDRPAIVRAMVDLPAGRTSATLTLTVEIDGRRFNATEALVGPSVASQPESGISVPIPSDAMNEGATFRVDLTDDAGDVVARFPASGEAPLDAVVTGPLAIHVVPYRVNGFVPDTSAAVSEGMRAAMMALYPVTAVSITVGAVEDRGVVEGNPLGELLVRTGEIQEADWAAGGDPRVFFYGVVTGVATREEFTGPTGTSEAGPRGGEQHRAYFAVGAAFGDQRSEDTLAHEIGHAHQLLHAPCDASEGLDDDFPQADGSIGVEGFDIRTDTFISPDTNDMMSNCRPRWISDYDYAIAADHVVVTQTFQPFGGQGP
jgi:hypothetical protein